jgi:hypothetical protein
LASAHQLLLNRFHDDSVPQLRRLILIGFIWAWLGWMIIGSATSLMAVSLALVIRAMGGSANWTYSSAILQKAVPDRYLGRVFSLDFAMFQLATVLSTIAHGGIVDALGVGRLSLIAYGTAAVSLLPIIAWMVVLPRMKRYEVSPATGD